MPVFNQKQIKIKLCANLVNLERQILLNCIADCLACFLTHASHFLCSTFLHIILESLFIIIFQLPCSFQPPFFTLHTLLTHLSLQSFHPQLYSQPHFIPLIPPIYSWTSLHHFSLRLFHPTYGVILTTYLCGIYLYCHRSPYSFLELDIVT